MLRAEELMIGDWVQVTHIGRPRYVKVTYLGLPDKIVYDFKDEVIVKSGKAYSPIPLTAEILEKNGIKFQYGKVWYQPHKDRIQLAWEHNGDTIRLCVDYVHQCQHALRLCGLNELADNFQV